MGNEDEQDVDWVLGEVREGAEEVEDDAGDVGPVRLADVVAAVHHALTILHHLKIG